MYVIPWFAVQFWDTFIL